MRRSAIGALVVLCAVAACLATAVIASASPAAPNTIHAFKQPNGTALKLRLWGDEFVHGWETLDGYSVQRDGHDGFWKYARRNLRGLLVPSHRVVGIGATPLRVHLRPTSAAINAIRVREGARPLGVATLATAPPWAGSDTDVLFIMVQFKSGSTQCSFTPGQMQANMFGATASGPGNLNAFFKENSYNTLDLVGTVRGDSPNTACATLANDRAFYNDETTNADGDDDLVREAVSLVDPYIDFANYDNDNDGNVDALGIIYAGGGPHDGCTAGSNSNNLWPHSGGLADSGVASGDGKTIDRFIINSEITHPAGSNTCNQIQTIGLFAHELGHSLGLPDLYDTDSSSWGDGSWTTMSSQFRSTTNLADTPPEYDAWSKAFEGWVTPIVHQAGDRVLESLSQVEDTGEVHEFLNNPGGFQTGGSGEYFLVENRQLTKFDAQLPGCGILIWHVDEAQPFKDFNAKEGHTAGAHRGLDLEQADGNNELAGKTDTNAYADVNNGGDTGDPFPGAASNSLFADSTTPNSKLYSGSSSNVRVKIKATSCSSDMAVAFGPNQAPTASAGGPYSTPEGTDVGLTAAGSSDPDGDSLSYAWDLDNDGQYDDSTSQTPTFTNVGDNNVFTVGVQVTDSFGDSSTASTTDTVTNVNPSVVNVTQNGPRDENDGTGVTVAATVKDPGWLDGLTATIDWGDGNGPQVVSGAAENTRPDATLAISSSHNYGDNGVFSVTVCGADDDGGSGCAAPIGVTVTNVKPTATIDQSGTILINGVPTVISQAGASVGLSGRSTDPGSDDLTLAWDWNDGSPVTSTPYLVNPPNHEPLAPTWTPTVQPRDVTDTKSHAFAACLYDVKLSSTDDDTGSTSSTVKVLITGTSTARFSVGYWQRQYSGKPTDFSNATLLCYLKIVRYVSLVFDEKRPLSTVQQAENVLKAGGGTSETEQFDRQLLAALFNFANGDPDYNELIDTNGNKVGDTPFLTVLANAEAVRLNPASTKAQIVEQKDLLERIDLDKA